MNILELLFEGRKPKIDRDKFSKLFPFFEQNKENKADTSIETGYGAAYLFRGYLYWLGYKDEAFITRCIDTLNKTEPVMNALGIKRTLSVFDDIINVVNAGGRTKFINDLKRKAEEKKHQKTQPQKTQPQVPTEQKQRGRKKEFKNKFTFSRQGIKGRPPKTTPHRGNQGNIKAKYDIISSEKDYNTFISGWSKQIFAPYSFLKTRCIDPVIITFEVKGKGPYFVYTNKDRNDFFIYGEVKERGRGGGLIQTPIELTKLADKMNDGENVITFLKKFPPEKIEQMNYNDFINLYYNSNTNFNCYNNKIVVNIWYLILKYIFNKYKSDPPKTVEISEENFNKFKEHALPLKGQSLTNAIGNFNIKNTFSHSAIKPTTLKEWLEEWDI